MSDTIKIKRAILHVLDNTNGISVFSDREMEIDGDISEFLEKHIERLSGDNNLKNASFTGETNYIRDICMGLSADTDSFPQASIYTAQALFEIMSRNVDIAPADVICCLFEYCGRPCYGILKLNYKTGYTHYVEKAEEGTANTIIRHKAILPSESQKIDECAFISLDDLSVMLLEKSYEINGEKDFYLSKLFLNCSTALSDNEKLKIIDKVTKKINRKFFDEDFDKVAKLKKAVSESIEENSAFEVSAIAEEVFHNDKDIQDEYIAEMQKAGLNETTISVPERLAERKYRTLRLKTDTGVEINFPPSYYDDKEKMEFINNPDGTISILIKNVGRITNR